MVSWVVRSWLHREIGRASARIDASLVDSVGDDNGSGGDGSALL